MTSPFLSVPWRWLLAGLLLGCFLLGCGSPQRRYRVLSFFFDGVPNPDAPKGQKGSFVTGKSGNPIYVHKPYEEKHCDSCHENTTDVFSMIKVNPEVCGGCHYKILTQYPRMHGPVASIKCLMCHNPHQSAEKHLLKLPSPKLCVQCHEPPTLNPRTPEHTDPKADCISCHSGHGGTNRQFLKPAPTTLAANPATRPATNPSTQPAGKSKVSP